MCWTVTKLGIWPAEGDEEGKAASLESEEGNGGDIVCVMIWHDVIGDRTKFTSHLISPPPSANNNNRKTIGKKVECHYLQIIEN